LAQEIAIGYSSQSAVVPADEQLSAFCIFLPLLVFPKKENELRKYLSLNLNRQALITE